MSNLSKAERDKLPAGSFALPSKRLYPILDQEDVDAAVRLVGKHPEAKPGIIARAKALGLKLPDTWKTANHSLFALAPAAGRVAGETVLRTGKIWEAGDYPDKDFGMTPEEVWESIQDFQPVPITDTHPDPSHQSVFDGVGLGRLVAVDMADDGCSLVGTVEVPAWINEALPGEIPLSAGWGTETRKLDHLAFVLNPRVSDAALVAAFAKRHDTPQGRMSLQDIHDAAARGGAVCKAPTANMASRHESSAMQQAHDVAVEHGAQCASMSGRGGMPWFSRGGRVMSFTENLRRWISGGMQGEAPVPEIEPNVAAFSTVRPVAAVSGGIAGAALPAAPDPEKDALRQQLAAFQEREKQAVLSAAVEFARGEVAAKRSAPADEEKLRTDYLAYADADAKLGATVNFAAGGSSLLARYKADLQARPADPKLGALAGQQIPATPPAGTYFSGQSAADGTAEDEAKRVAAMLRASASGRAVLGRNGAQHQN